MIKTYEDWENSLDKNYVNQLGPDAWDLTCEAFEAGQQSQQAKIDELQARIDKVVHILTYTNHASTPLCNELRDILKGNKDEK